ncbi:MAG: NADH-ubiquinone oxidoreductase-F iron-sulfur binding region domain-containing protein [Vicinamibacterales bacterium]
MAAADLDSFYHLKDADLGDRACRGLACFVARDNDPARWERACEHPRRVYCLGKCYRSPAAGCDPERPLAVVHAREAIVLRDIVERRESTLEAFRSRGGYHALEAALRKPPEEIVRAIEASELRGRGGAGYPTGRKWRAVLRQRSDEKYVVANADEGDPGAYIDRLILEDSPHVVIEALAIAGYAVGARRGYIYLRTEYPDARTRLTTAIAQARDAGLLGAPLFGSSFAFDLHLDIGGGSYLCGEETALLNAIEGRRPEVRARPPYPSESGLFGKPTLVNNVETLASVPWIVEHGGEAYHSLGFSTSRGTKVLSLNSLFRRPGLYEVEFGLPIRQIVDELGGGLRSGTLKGVIIGGPLAGVIPPALLDTPLGFEELHAIGASVGHGGVVAFDERTSIPELVQHVFDFGAYESCGKCTPCRLGTRRVEGIFRQILTGSGATMPDRDTWHELIHTLAMTSLCGHGTGLAEFAESIVRHYRPELESCFAS